jgi:hypothetical protein
MHPHAHHFVVVAATGVTIGTVDRYLGILDAMLGHHDEAARWFEAALTQEGAVGARPSVARTSYWFAWSSLADGDRVRAGELLESCLAIATDLGMAKLAEQALSLAASY